MQKERLIRECLKGNQGAWQMLVDTYSRRIFNLAYQFSGTREEAEDMTQEIFLKLYHALVKYDFSRNFDAWLLTLARNHLIDEYRRTKWERKTRDDFNEYTLSADITSNPEDRILKDESKRLVWEGFNSLSADLRMAVILRDIQGKKYEEIAEILELPLGTVKSRVNRGRLQLAKVLRDKKEATYEM
ncbi:MAG: sigma-70 family RNA polymerase sigma factor [Candidatus Aminicenantes bacterium]|nr:sigma-70 family RNA polymerase sigma factor [Candidatus Aminicenantes bacterium]